jgi:hypothetical protein
MANTPDLRNLCAGSNLEELHYVIQTDSIDTDCWDIGFIVAAKSGNWPMLNLLLNTFVFNGNEEIKGGFPGTEYANAALLGRV